jgi:hypothetical protein
MHYGVIMAKKKHTTQRHFKMFKQEAEKWIDIFGLKCWEVVYRHATLESLASCLCNYESHSVILTLGRDWSDTDFPLNDEEVRKCAFHEVMEIFTMGVRDAACERFNVSPDTVDERIHMMIRTLENVVFKNGDFFR